MNKAPAFQRIPVPNRTYRTEKLLAANWKFAKVCPHEIPYACQIQKL